MKKLLMLLSLFSIQAKADVITCVFTEPFTTTIYSTPKSKLTYKSMDKLNKVIPHVSLQIKGEGVFELISKEGKVIQTLTLNHKGSDGMSDTQYPYDVQDNDNLTGKGRGGCSSNFLKSTPK